MRNIPITHYNAVESPFLPQDILEKHWAFCTVYALDSSITGDVQGERTGCEPEVRTYDVI